MRKFARRSFLFGLGGVAGWSAAKILGKQLPVYDGTQTVAQASGEAFLNDASGLSATPIHKHIIIKDDPGTALVDAVRREMTAAANDGRAFNIGAARHSMGGQAIPRDGYALTFDNAFLEPDQTNKTYRVHAGARWADVIKALDPLGWSPKVMQSNNDFGVAATFSVNAHGWPVPFGPMGSTVRSLNMVLPSGDLVACSPVENADLFNAAMGGYGLIGAIVDLEVEMARNTRLDPTFTQMPARDFAKSFDAAIKDPAITMAYGRLNVERSSFFEHALMVTYSESDDQTEIPAAVGSGMMAHLASRIYRGQLGNEKIKTFRWWNETKIAPAIGGGAATRNSLINEPVITLDDRNPHRTDILHEYFIGFDQFDAFLTACRDVIPASYQEFLNVTLRYIAPDAQSRLSYAPVPRIAAVMSFSQEMTARAEADMQRMTRELVDRITAIGGTYYLPYRPHVRVDQLVAGYPQAAAFVQEKRSIDPDLVLRNNLWDRYLSAL